MDARLDTIAALDAKARRMRTPSGDGEMVWRLWGDGPPLVLCHGGFGSWTHWIRNIEFFAERFTVICPDLPGLGESHLPTPDYTPKNLAAVLVQGLDRVIPPPGRYHMAGFSTGGLLGGHAAAAQGSRVKSFTLVGASGFGPIRRRPGRITRRADSGDPAEVQVIQRDNLAVLMFADADKIDDLAIHIQTENVKRGRVRSRKMALSDTLLRKLPEITAPMGGIWGEHDVTAPPEMADREAAIRASHPELDFRVIEGAGHWVMYEAADAFNAALLEVLAKRA